jgi:hypothetical protein
MNKETAGDDPSLTLQTGFVTKALLGLFAFMVAALRLRTMAVRSSTG